VKILSSVFLRLAQIFPKGLILDGSESQPEIPPIAQPIFPIIFPTIQRLAAFDVTTAQDAISYYNSAQNNRAASSAAGTTTLVSLKAGVYNISGSLSAISSFTPAAGGAPTADLRLQDPAGTQIKLCGIYTIAATPSAFGTFSCLILLPEDGWAILVGFIATGVGQTIDIQSAVQAVRFI
jgi:Zn-dependent M28 family amino/carboxypeptidase